MSSVRLWPARSQKQAPEVVLDLDDIVSKKVAFRFGGKVFEVEPVSVGGFVQVAGIMGEIQQIAIDRAKGENVSEERAYDAYFRFISPLCKGVTESDLKSMEIPQLHALVNLLIKHLTGRTGSEGQEEKKKTSLK